MNAARRSLPLVLLVIACTRPSTSTPRASAGSCDPCPQPECPQLDCPQTTCPECPTPQTPIATDWHCLDLQLPSGDVADYCFTNAAICEEKRELARSDTGKWGVTTPCETQRIAYCVHRNAASRMLRRSWCARTPEDCDARRREVIEISSEHDEIGTCRPTWNNESLQAADIPGWGF